MIKFLISNVRIDDQRIDVSLTDVIYERLKYPAVCLACGKRTSEILYKKKGITYCAISCLVIALSFEDG